jgi:hypothetical protein
LITGFFRCNLGTETLLGANWGCQTCTHRIREEGESVTWQHLIGPPQHVSATWQHLIGSPHPCRPHIPDRWVPLMPHGSTTLSHISRQLGLEDMVCLDGPITACHLSLINTKQYTKQLMTGLVSPDS